MCIVFFDWSPPKNQLIVCHNRDEELTRESQTTRWWTIPVATEQQQKRAKEKPNDNDDENTNDDNIRYYQVLSPLDVKGGGTWFGYETTTNRCAFLTNVRNKADSLKQYKSTRGALVLKYLTCTKVYNSALEYAQHELASGDNQNEEEEEYAGYNIILFSGQDLVYYSNRSGNPPESLPMGSYGLSNTLLYDPFPKVSYGMVIFRHCLTKRDNEGGFDLMMDELKILMKDQTQCYNDQIPKTTGYTNEFEAQCSSICVPIVHSYGTRTTILFVWNKEKILLVEQNLNPKSLQWEEQTIEGEPIFSSSQQTAPQSISQPKSSLSRVNQVLTLDFRASVKSFPGGDG